MITAGRVAEIVGQLEAAGAGWADVARKLPEFERLHLGRPSGPGLVRPWVLLTGPHERYDTPVRLVRHENGRWFLKGTVYAKEIETHGATTERAAHAADGEPAVLRHLQAAADAPAEEPAGDGLPAARDGR